MPLSMMKTPRWRSLFAAALVATAALAATASPASAQYYAPPPPYYGPPFPFSILALPFYVVSLPFAALGGFGYRPYPPPYGPYPPPYYYPPYAAAPRYAPTGYEYGAGGGLVYRGGD